MPKTIGKKRIEKDITCQSKILHEDVVNKLKVDSIAESEDIQSLASFFSMFADSTRLRIISLLMKEELCVCDITHLLKLKQPAVSQQLSTLWKSRVIKRRKEGNQVFYRLEDEHIEKIFKIGEEHIYE